MLSTTVIIVCAGLAAGAALVAALVVREAVRIPCVAVDVDVPDSGGDGAAVPSSTGQVTLRSGELPLLTTQPTIVPVRVD